eukprot:UN1886
MPVLVGLSRLASPGSSWGILVKEVLCANAGICLPKKAVLQILRPPLRCSTVLAEFVRVLEAFSPRGWAQELLHAAATEPLVHAIAHHALHEVRGCATCQRRHLLLLYEVLQGRILDSPCIYGRKVLQLPLHIRNLSVRDLLSDSQGP